MATMTRVLVGVSVLVGACVDEDPDGALTAAAGAQVTIERDAAGATRVIAIPPGFAVARGEADPARAAAAFVAEHHGVLGLTADDAARVEVRRVDLGPDGGHITLERVVDGVPVFHGGLTVHLDRANRVYRVVGDEHVFVGAPTNRLALTPAAAAIAAARPLGLALIVGAAHRDGLATVVDSPSVRDPLVVEPRIFQVALGDDRLAYQVLLSWLDGRTPRYELVVVDGETGGLLHHASLTEAFTGRVFSAANQIGATNPDDARGFRLFNGDPTASPSGWVDATRRTQGNNAVAATDLDASNTVGANEIQPTANASNVFDFPFNANADAAGFREAAVTNAFYYVNDWHDRMYVRGFTEAAGNFQLANFGRGGVANDPVTIDVQDSLGTNNAFFATPPDGSRPRMELLLWDACGASRRDSAFDASVVYHENTHGLSNRLVAGGSPSCLTGVQSGGMGEGWGDFMAASILDNPVHAAYVSCPPFARLRSMAASPFTYDDLQLGTLTEVHDAGEIWAATLWDIRKIVGRTTVERIVVAAMKLTPCNPTMVQARDAILAADQALFGGTHRCDLWTAFANRGLGTGAASPTHNSTTAIVTSSATPADCPTTVTRDYAGIGLPKAVPDNDPAGRSVFVTVLRSPDLLHVAVDVDISSVVIGDMVIQVIAPDGQVATLSNNETSFANRFIVKRANLDSLFATRPPANGGWSLFVRDRNRLSPTTIRDLTLYITSSR